MKHIKKTRLEYSKESGVDDIEKIEDFRKLFSELFNVKINDERIFMHCTTDILNIDIE